TGHTCGHNLIAEEGVVAGLGVKAYIETTGSPAHAAAFSWEGVNALDAAVLAYTNVSLLGQQMKPS
uniref:Peptidase M20 dimerisation domain-containing protein n=1 Tax=Amphimedon queenslandica TaxID=400682 RepID=A0A1X7SIF5_AMPQE